MKLIFLASSFTIIYYMRFHPSVKQTYDAENDSFKVIFLVAPAAVLALLINQEFGVMEVCHDLLYSVSSEHSQCCPSKVNNAALYDVHVTFCKPLCGKFLFLEITVPACKHPCEVNFL